MFKTQQSDTQALAHRIDSICLRGTRSSGHVPEGLSSLPGSFAVHSYDAMFSCCQWSCRSCILADVLPSSRKQQEMKTWNRCRTLSRVLWPRVVSSFCDISHPQYDSEFCQEKTKVMNPILAEVSNYSFLWRKVLCLPNSTKADQSLCESTHTKVTQEGPREELQLHQIPTLGNSLCYMRENTPRSSLGQRGRISHFQMCGLAQGGWTGTSWITTGRLHR